MCYVIENYNFKAGCLRWNYRTLVFFCTRNLSKLFIFVEICHYYTNNFLTGWTKCFPFRLLISSFFKKNIIQPVTQVTENLRSARRSNFLTSLTYVFFKPMTKKNILGSYVFYIPVHVFNIKKYSEPVISIQTTFQKRYFAKLLYFYRVLILIKLLCW